MSVDPATISIIIALVGCAIGVSGWVTKREDRRGADAEWRGSISAKLDNIMCSVAGLRDDVERIDRRLNEHAERIAKVEASSKQAHHRLDEMYATTTKTEEDTI